MSVVLKCVKREFNQFNQCDCGLYFLYYTEIDIIFRPEQAKTLASSMIGKLLITKQTGTAGKICNSVMVTTRMFPRKEYYISVMMETSFDVNYNDFYN